MFKPSAMGIDCPDWALSSLRCPKRNIASMSAAAEFRETKERMAPKAARAKRWRKAMGQLEGSAEESGESGNAGWSNGEGAGGRQQERVRKDEKRGHGRRGNGLWSKGNIVQGTGFDSIGGENHAPSFHAVSEREGAWPRHID